MARRRYHYGFDAIKHKRFLKEGRGRGEGKDYLPWVRVQDVPSRGFSSRIKGWKTARIHHVLSNYELYTFLVGEWSRLIVDIREQYPLLELEETLAIAKRCGVRHPTDPKTRYPIVMTTDFLFTLLLDGQRVLHACTFKHSKDLAHKRTREKMEIEKRYWRERGVNWKIITEFDIPLVLAKNVDNIHESYYLSTYKDTNLIAEIAHSLTALVQRQQRPLSRLALQCDAQHDQPPGTSLQVAYFLIATHQWHINMNLPLHPSRPLSLIKASLRDSQEEVASWQLASTR